MVIEFTPLNLQISFHMMVCVILSSGESNVVSSDFSSLFVWYQGRLQVSGKGGAGEGLVGDCGLVFPGADPRYQVIRGVLKICGVFCVKNQDFMQKIIFSPILGGVPGVPPLNPPLVPVVTTIVRRCY